MIFSIDRIINKPIARDESTRQMDFDVSQYKSRTSGAVV
jgi:hypothetical protein